MSSVTEMLRLRADGMTCTEIARELGITRQAVVASFSKLNTKHFQYHSEKGCVYKGLREWMNENKVSTVELVCMLGYIPHGNTVARFRYYLKGENNPRKCDIDLILKVTGMTYEQCFEEG